MSVVAKQRRRYKRRYYRNADFNLFHIVKDMPLTRVDGRKGNVVEKNAYLLS